MSQRFRSGGTSRGQMGFGRWFAIAMAGLLISGCGLAVGGGAVKAGIVKLETDVQFGLGLNQAPAAVPVPQPSPVFVPLPSFSYPAFTSPSFNVGGLCPAAPANSFPTAEATSTVSTTPPVGQSKWAGGGSWVDTVLTTKINLPLPMTYESVVRNVQMQSDPLAGLPGSQPQMIYTYELIQPDFSNTRGFWDYHFQVKTNAQEGDPEGGLALKEVDHYDPAFKTATQLFVGDPALLLLPLPANPGPVGIGTPAGNEGQPTSIDTSGNNNDMSFSGKVGPHERVDACGTPIQAWPVDGTLTNGSGSQATVHLDVATQWGALVVAFDIDGTWMGVTYSKATQRIGQTTPDPIPAEFK